MYVLLSSSWLWVGLLSFAQVHCHNVEVRKSHTFNLREAAEGSNRTGNQSSFAGYTFDLRMTEDGNARLMFGQPRPESMRETISKGAIYSCDIAVNSSMLSRAVAFSEAKCTPVVIFPENKLSHRRPDHNVSSDAMGLSMARKNDSFYAVCAPIRRRLCPNVSYVPGACYVGGLTDGYWEYIRWPNETGCFTSSVEVVFVVDGSSSIKSANFKLVKDWVISVTEQLVRSFGETVQTQVVQYALKPEGDLCNSPAYVVPYTLREFLTVDEMKGKLEKMKYLAGRRTYTLVALERVLKCDFQSGSDAHQIVVVLTDGQTNGATDISNWYRKNIQGTKVTPFVVAVGNYEAYGTQSSYIAHGNRDSKERVLTVDDFEKLSTVIERLTNSISSAVSLEGTSTAAGSSDPNTDIASPQLGLSIAFGKDQLFVGGPGMFLQSGNIMSVDLKSGATLEQEQFLQIDAALRNGTVDSLAGFSLVTGNFDGVEYVVAGAPRHLFTGAVLFCRTRVEKSPVCDKTILPNYDQVATYFGGSVLTVDINGDNNDELLISAPLYSGADIDVGRVFVYISENSNSIEAWTKRSYGPQILRGDDIGERFGTAMAYAGDLDMDGYNDVVIGAPLADEGLGSIYIFRGKSTGLEVTFSQKIQASHNTASKLQYFGQYLQGNVDIDDNGYPDLIVASPKSEHLTILRTRPIVDVTVEIRFSDENMSFPICLKNEGINCTTLHYCFNVSDSSTGNGTGVRYVLQVDTGKPIKEKRLLFSNLESTITEDVSLTPQQSCFRQSVNLKMEMSNDDYIHTPIKAEITFELQHEHLDVLFSSVLNRNLPTTYSTEVKVNTGCEEMICSSDVGVAAYMLPSPEFQIQKGAAVRDISENGTVLVVAQSTASSSLRIRVNWSNHEEYAFDPVITISYSKGITLNQVRTIAAFPQSDSCILPIESVPQENDNMVQQFLRHQPVLMDPNSWCFFEISVMADSLKNPVHLSNAKFNISTYLKSPSSQEVNPENNVWYGERPIRYVSYLDVQKQSSDARVTLNSTNTFTSVSSVSNIGGNYPDISMQFKIKSGYAAVSKSVMSLQWPWMMHGDNPLLYLYDVECLPIDAGITCSCDNSKVNPYQLPIEPLAGNETNRTSYATMPATEPINADELNCSGAFETNHSCEELKCEVANLGLTRELSFVAHFRLWSSSITFRQTNKTFLNLKSRLSIASLETAHNLYSEHGERMFDFDEIIVQVQKYTPIRETDTTDELTFVIVAAAVGFLVICLLTIILWKAGFFENNYRTKLQQQQSSEQLIKEEGAASNDAESELSINTVPSNHPA